MAAKRKRDPRPAVGRLARFNMMATLAIALSATVVVALAGFIGYSLVLVTAERNISQRLETLQKALKLSDDRIWATEMRELARLATTGQSVYPAFTQVYRPGKGPQQLSLDTRQQLDSRLSVAPTGSSRRRVSSWIESSDQSFARWLCYHDRLGHALAVKVDYRPPAAKRLMDRRLGRLGDLHGVTVTWFPRLSTADQALNREMRGHGLPGSWNAMALEGIHRSQSGLHITVNQTQVQGDAIALAVPLQASDLLVVAFSDRTTLGAVLHYARYVVVATVAMGGVIWGVAVVWIRGTRRQASLALQQSNFVAAVSHELRTPLTAIRGAAEMLAHDMVPDAKKATYYQSILGEADRLSRMVEQILDFDRLQRGQLDVTVQPTDLSAVVQRVAAMMQPVAAKRNVQLDVVPADALTVAVDPDTMAQALTNLIDNAIKFSPSGADVRIEMHEGDATALLAVEDSGPGVPASERKAIFDAFYRVGDENTRKTKGSGLGLYLVQRYVEAVGGTIRVKDAHGGGARFEMELPLA